MSTLILAEKHDQARKYMEGLGIKYKTPASYFGVGKTFLDDKTIVVGANGHLFELAEPEQYDSKYKNRANLDLLPIFPKKFKYTISYKKVKNYKLIAKYAKAASRIIVATDKDNEGGAIAYNVLLMANCLNKPVLRAYPTGLNKAEVIRTFKRLEPIKQTWLDASAAIARSRSDWLIGMNLSRLYTTKLAKIDIHGNFAIGRAISSTLSIICEWYKSIDNFHKEPIYSLDAVTKLGDTTVKLSSSVKVQGDGKNDAKREMIKQIKQHKLRSPMEGLVQKVKSREQIRYPGQLLTKADLYSEMNRVAGWSRAKSEKTMQTNYQEGYQTYPRTDSPKIDRYTYDYLYQNFDKYMEAIGLSNKFIRFKLPEEALKKYLTPEKSAGAHMAIVPTQQLMTKTSKVTNDQRLMWEVVVRKTMTLMVNPYKYVSNELVISANDVNFSARNTVPLDQGWKDIIMPKQKKAKSKKDAAKKTLGVNYSKIIKEGAQVPLTLKTRKSFTVPPKPLKTIQLYAANGLMEKAYQYVDDPELAKILKKAKGIGTSATKDKIVESLEAKGYIKTNSKDVISVTAEGWLIYWLLKGSLVSNPALSARWEEVYKLIAAGKADTQSLINSTAKLVIAEIQRSNNDWNISKIKSFYNKYKTNDVKSISIGNCPICQKGQLVFQKYYGKKKPSQKDGWDGYACTNCHYKIFNHYNNVKIKKSDFKKMLAGQESSLYKGVLNKKGKTFSCKFHIITREDGNLKVEPVFKRKIYPEQFN